MEPARSVHTTANDDKKKRNRFRKGRILVPHALKTFELVKPQSALNHWGHRHRQY